GPGHSLECRARAGIRAALGAGRGGPVQVIELGLTLPANMTGSKVFGCAHQSFLASIFSCETGELEPHLGRCQALWRRTSPSRFEAARSAHSAGADAGSDPRRLAWCVGKGGPETSGRQVVGRRPPWYRIRMRPYELIKRKR